MNTHSKMTIETLRAIIEENGTEHARFCLEQDATQFGESALADLFAELERLENENLMENFNYVGSRHHY